MKDREDDARYLASFPRERFDNGINKWTGRRALCWAATGKRSRDQGGGGGGLSCLLPNVVEISKKTKNKKKKKEMMPHCSLKVE